MEEVSVIIVNYNTTQLTRACLQSLMLHTTGISYEVIVVDNASKEPANALKLEFPEIVFIQSTTNLGFAGGNNLGIEQAKGEYILLLNSDTLLKENSIKISLDFLKKRQEVGVVSCRLIYPNGQHQSVAQRFPSIKYALIELFRLQKLMSKEQAGKCLLGSFFDHQSTTQVDWVWGAFFMFKASHLSLLPNKKLDDTYFMYYEDMQWCLDFKKQGLKTYFLADTEIIHLMGGSSANKEGLMKQNKTIFMHSNFSQIHLFLINQLQKLL